MVCRVPKCHHTRAGCRCPNPWIEFVSKTSKERRTQRATRLKMADYSRRYRQAKEDGVFVAPQELADAQRPCKSDTHKLCAWLVNRKQNVDVHASLLRARTSRALRLIASKLRTLPPDEELGLPLQDSFGLRSRGVALYGLLGSGAYGQVFLGMQTLVGARRRVAVKVVKLSTEPEHTRGDFTREVHTQKQFHLRAGVRAPRVYDAYVSVTTKRNVTSRHGIIIMEPIAGTVHSVLRSHDTPQVVLQYVARQLKNLVEALGHAKLLHGDMHHDNIAFMWRSGRPLLTLIDFGRAALQLPPDVRYYDAFWQWRASLRSATLNKALHAVGFPGSPQCLAMYGQSKPDVAVTARRQSNAHIMYHVMDRQTQLRETSVAAPPPIPSVVINM